VDANLSLAQMAKQTKEFFLGLSNKQRALLAGGAVLVTATLCVFVQLIARPDYKVLYSGLTPADTQDLVARLNAKQIPTELSPDGSSILVPGDKLDSARLEIASQPMPHSGRMGFELFDKPNWAGSDFSEKVNYQRALEAELERTLATLREVEAVRVHLVMPAESLYTERERAAKASVMVKLRHGHLPEQADMAIRQMVAGAVDRLTPENVAVVDADTNLPLGRFGSNPTGGASEMDQELAKRVVETLEPVVGAQGVRASVHVEYDLSSGDETQETYDPNSSVALSVTRSEERLGNDSLGGVPGTSSNLPNAKVSTPAKSANESHTTKAESGTYAVNKLVRHTLLPSGRVRRIAAALLVDDAIEIEQKNNQRTATRRKRSPDELKQIEQLAAAALGIDPKRGDVLAVENLSFQNLQDVPAPPTFMERTQRTLHNWTWVFRYLALACLFGSVYVLLLRPMKKQFLTMLRELPTRIAGRQAGAEGAQTAAAKEPETLEAILEAAGVDGDVSLKKLAILKNHLVDKVKSEPAAASRLIQNWLREGSTE
jgi:flagellar M-ring protein FliF